MKRLNLVFFGLILLLATSCGNSFLSKFSTKDTVDITITLPLDALNSNRSARDVTDPAPNELAVSLPYGLQRRLEIARALATKPTLLLLDEPAAGMNPQETAELADFVRVIRDKYDLTVFLIEHHMDLVMNISDYIYVIDFGSEIARGIPSEIQSNKRVIDAYLGTTEEDGQ